MTQCISQPTLCLRQAHINTEVTESLRFKALIREDAKVQPFADKRRKAAPSPHDQLFQDPECWFGNLPTRLTKSSKAFNKLKTQTFQNTRNPR